MLARVMCSVELLGLLLEPTISTPQGRQDDTGPVGDLVRLVAMKEGGQVPRRQLCPAVQSQSPRLFREGRNREGSWAHRVGLLDVELFMDEEGRDVWRGVLGEAPRGEGRWGEGVAA